MPQVRAVAEMLDGGWPGSAGSDRDALEVTARRGLQVAAQALALGQVALQQADALGGSLRGGDAARVLLGPDVAERLVEGLVGLAHGVEVGGVPAGGMIAHSQGLRPWSCPG